MSYDVRLPLRDVRSTSGCPYQNADFGFCKAEQKDASAQATAKDTGRFGRIFRRATAMDRN